MSKFTATIRLEHPLNTYDLNPGAEDFQQYVRALRYDNIGNAEMDIEFDGEADTALRRAREIGLSIWNVEPEYLAVVSLTRHNPEDIDPEA